MAKTDGNCMGYYKKLYRGFQELFSKAHPTITFVSSLTLSLVQNMTSICSNSNIVSNVGELVSRKICSLIKGRKGNMMKFSGGKVDISSKGDEVM